MPWKSSSISLHIVQGHGDCSVLPWGLAAQGDSAVDTPLMGRCPGQGRPAEQHCHWRVQDGLAAGLSGGRWLFSDMLLFFLEAPPGEVAAMDRGGPLGSGASGRAQGDQPLRPWQVPVSSSPRAWLTLGSRTALSMSLGASTRVFAVISLVAHLSTKVSVPDHFHYLTCI